MYPYQMAETKRKSIVETGRAGVGQIFKWTMWNHAVAYSQVFVLSHGVLIFNIVHSIIYYNMHARASK